MRLHERLRGLAAELKKYSSEKYKDVPENLMLDILEEGAKTVIYHFRDSMADEDVDMTIAMNDRLLERPERE